MVIEWTLIVNTEENPLERLQDFAEDSQEPMIGNFKYWIFFMNTIVVLVNGMITEIFI